MPKPEARQRPDPERLLRELDLEQRESGAARLKVFLGYSSGVGKSFRMLDEARRRKARGQDVIVGASQPKVTLEIAPLLNQMEVIPFCERNGGVEMDLPSILKRAPQVCLVDGLSATNPPGGMHAERWQDVEELLAAGINIIASVNLQFIAERQQQVEAITGKHVHHTVPLEFLRKADEIVIVDAPTEQLDLPPEQCRQFAALREIALIVVADVVDFQLEQYLQANHITQSFGANERVLICLTPRTNPSKMLASGQRIVKRFHGQLLAAAVVQPNLSAEDEAALERNFSAAKEAGADVTKLDSEDVIAAILDFAVSRGVTQIFIGHGQRRSSWQALTMSPVDRLLADPRGIDIRVFPH